MELTGRDIALAKWKVRAHDDPLFFGKYVLGYDKLIGRIHGEQLRAAQEYDKLLFLEPRGHFKTTCISHTYLMWRIMRNPNIRILLVHKPLREALGYVAVIREQFERNEIFRSLWGDWTKARGWSDTGITVSHRRKVMKEPTLSCSSPDHDPTGGHFDIIACDDMVGMKDRYSAAERLHTSRFMQGLWGMLEPNGQAIFTGTRWSASDGYGQILGNPAEKIAPREDFYIRVRQATGPDGKIYFPEEFNRDRLDDIRRGMGDTLYESQMQNNPIPEGMRRFDIDRLHFIVPDAMPAEGKTIAFIDPAVGESLDKGDYTFSIFLRTTGGKTYVVDACYGQEPYATFSARFIEKVKKWAPQVLFIESVAFQTFFARAMGDSLAKAGMHVRIAQVKQNKSKQERIEGMEPVLTGGEVVFRADWDFAYPQLMSQLCDWPTAEHDDGPDALEGGLAAALGRGAKRKVTMAHLRV